MLIDLKTIEIAVEALDDGHVRIQLIVNGKLVEERKLSLDESAALATAVLVAQKRQAPVA